MDGTVITDDFWPYPQIFAIPSYLRVSNFLNQHPLLPVNETVMNTITADAHEAYTLVLAGYGFSMVPGHLLMPHPELAFLKWKTSPTSPMGIYHGKGKAKENPVLLKFLRIAKDLYSS